MSWSENITEKNIGRRLHNLLGHLQAVIDLWDENDLDFLQGLTKHLGMRVRWNDNIQSLKNKVFKALPLAEDFGNEIDPLTFSKLSEILPQLVLEYQDERGFTRAASLSSLMRKNDKLFNLSTQTHIPVEAYGKIVDQIALIETHFAKWIPDRHGNRIKKKSLIQQSWTQIVNEGLNQTVDNFENAMIHSLDIFTIIYFPVCIANIISILQGNFQPVQVYLLVAAVLGLSMNLRFGHAPRSRAFLRSLFLHIDFIFLLCSLMLILALFPKHTPVDDLMRKAFLEPLLRTIDFVQPAVAKIKEWHEGFTEEDWLRGGRSKNRPRKRNIL